MQTKQVVDEEAKSKKTKTKEKQQQLSLAVMMYTINLVKKSSNKSVYGNTVIFTPLNLSLDSSSLLSYTVYNKYSKYKVNIII